MHIIAAHCLKRPVVIIHEIGICHCGYNHTLLLTTTAMCGRGWGNSTGVENEVLYTS